jgi:hypothetical protein
MSGRRPFPVSLMKSATRDQVTSCQSEARHPGWKPARRHSLTTLPHNYCTCQTVQLSCGRLTSLTDCMLQYLRYMQVQASLNAGSLCRETIVRFCTEGPDSDREMYLSSFHVVTSGCCNCHKVISGKHCHQPKQHDMYYYMYLHVRITVSDHL